MTLPARLLAALLLLPALALAHAPQTSVGTDADIKVGGHTQLNGAVIASSATADKNRLLTGGASPPPGSLRRSEKCSAFRRMNSF